LGSLFAQDQGLSSFSFIQHLPTMPLLEKRTNTRVLKPKGNLGDTLPYVVGFLPKTLLVCQPEGLDLSSLLTKHGLNARWGNKKRQHKLAFVIHAVLEGCHRDVRNAGPAFYVPLNAQRLRAYLGAADTAPAVAALVGMGILEASPSNYSAGRYSRSYRLTDAYRKMPVVFRELENATLARRVHGEQTALNAAAVAGSVVRAFILANLASLTVSPAGDIHAATRKYRNSAEQSAWMATLGDIQQRRFWIAVHQDTGRTFHNAVQCPAELRGHLLIDGEETAEVDIANAQPFLMLSLYPKDAKLAAERARYATAVSNGHFYDGVFYGCENRRPWGGSLEAWSDPSGTHRNRFKKHFIEKVLYSVYDSESVSQVFESFRQLFPSLAATLAARRVTKASSTGLALEMQRRETELVLGRVFPRIMAELPGCKAISIHDGILCQARFAESVAEIVRFEAQALYGVAPFVRSK
jgi:hypothetical protein